MTDIATVSILDSNTLGPSRGQHIRFLNALDPARDQHWLQYIITATVIYPVLVILGPIHTL